MSIPKFVPIVPASPGEVAAAVRAGAADVAADVQRIEDRQKALEALTSATRAEYLRHYAARDRLLSRRHLGQ